MTPFSVADEIARTKSEAEQKARESAEAKAKLRETAVATAKARNEAESKSRPASPPSHSPEGSTPTEKNVTTTFAEAAVKSVEPLAPLAPSSPPPVRRSSVGRRPSEQLITPSLVHEIAFSSSVPPAVPLDPAFVSAAPEPSLQNELKRRSGATMSREPSRVALMASKFVVETEKLEEVDEEPVSKRYGVPETAPPPPSVAPPQATLQSVMMAQKSFDDDMRQDKSADVPKAVPSPKFVRQTTSTSTTAAVKPHLSPKPVRQLSVSNDAAVKPEPSLSVRRAGMVTEAQKPAETLATVPVHAAKNAEPQAPKIPDQVSSQAVVPSKSTETALPTVAAQPVNVVQEEAKVPATAAAKKYDFLVALLVTHPCRVGIPWPSSLACSSA